MTDEPRTGGRPTADQRTEAERRDDPEERTGHTPLSRSLLFMALLPALFGLLLGNAPMLLVGATVLLVLVRARENPPKDGRVAFVLPRTRLQRGTPVTASLEAELGPGRQHLGLIHQGLHPTFHLDHGVNVHLVEPDETPAFELSFVCPRRGLYELDGPTLELVHPLELAPAHVIAKGPAQELTVEPIVRPLRTVKQLRGRARDRHGEDRATRGPTSTEFMELRDYVRGDPLKLVNWKATAKRSTHEEDLTLVVNQFEPEARKHVWFFLDLDRSLEVGTTLSTALEDAIDVTLALVHHFTNRGHRVGGCTFNGKAQVFYPDSGTRQELTIARALARVVPGTKHEGLPAAVERVKGFLDRERPLVFVITRPDVDTEGLLEGTRRIHLHTASARRAAPVLVLAPEPPAGDVTDQLARALSALEARRVVQGAAGPLLRIHRLRDGARGLERALAKGVLAR